MSEFARLLIAAGVTTSRFARISRLAYFKAAEEAAPSTLAVVGRYIVQPEVLDRLSSTKQGEGGEIQLTDALASMIPDGPFHGYRFEGTRFDCGDKVGFIGANIAYALARPDMADGVMDFIKHLAPGR